MVVQTLAEDVLLHSVAIKSLEQLQNFELRLRKSTLPYRSPVTSSGCMIRSLDIDGFVDEIAWDTSTIADDKLAELMNWIDSVTSVICVLPLLRHFSLHELYATRGHIICLRLATQGQLTSLDITLWFDYNLSSGVFQCINSLERLKHLKLTIEDNASQDFPSSETALNIPSVITFELSSENISVSSYFEWISRCRFNVCCSVSFDIYSPLDTNIIPLLFPFFDAHQPRSVTLTTAVEVIEALAPRLSKVERLHLPFSGPESAYAFLTSAGRMPKHLTVDVNVCNYNGLQISKSFWKFLQLIPSRVSREHTTTKLCITITGADDTSRPFLWSDGATAKYGAFIGRLLTEAARIYEEGVIIEDGDGRDIKHIID
jgi:hypothetical protein